MYVSVKDAAKSSRTLPLSWLWNLKASMTMWSVSSRVLVKNSDLEPGNSESMRHLRHQNRQAVSLIKPPTQAATPKPSRRSPVFDEDMSGMREDVRGKRGHAAVHKHPQAQVVSHSDRGLHGDEVAQMEHVGASVVDPVV